jgi:PAS domain S-box
MSEGIIPVDEAGIIAAANPTAEHLFGYEKGHLAGVVLESFLPERYRNLISNASKYSPSDKSINITYQSIDGSAHFSVQDNGISIPLDDQKHLFSRFFRATNTRDIQGTGLGLNIIKRYVDLLHGSISFKSDIDKGTTFDITMPRH